MHRYLKHIFPPLGLRNVFSADALTRIESCCASSEKEHSAEIRFAVELALDIPRLVRGETARSRAVEVFSRLQVWDTEKNNGVLIYLLLAERDIEIVADRGAVNALGEENLKEICCDMEKALAAGDYIEGICNGVIALGRLLAPHYPPGERTVNQIPDMPEIVR